MTIDDLKWFNNNICVLLFSDVAQTPTLSLASSETIDSASLKKGTIKPKPVFVTKIIGTSELAKAKAQLPTVKKPATVAKKNKEEINLNEVLAGPKEPFKLVPNQGTGPMFLKFGDYLYLPHYKRAGIAYWRCQNFTKTDCPARVLVKDKFTYAIDVAHNH